MKRIAAVVALASLLAAPVVLAQDAKSHDAKPQAATQASDGERSQVEGSFRGTYSTDSRSGPWSPVQGSFRGSYSTDPRTGPWSEVRTSFQDTYVGE
jgi:Ni/Co efflux regulator RcnB